MCFWPQEAPELQEMETDVSLPETARFAKTLQWTQNISRNKGTWKKNRPYLKSDWKESKEGSKEEEELKREEKRTAKKSSSEPRRSAGKLPVCAGW